MKIGRNPSTQTNLREMLALHDQCVELLQEPISAADGFVKMPERPGLGVELDPVVVERYRVR